MFAFASDRVNLPTKVKMWKNLQSFRATGLPAVIGKGLVQMPSLKSSTKLPDLIRNIQSSNTVPILVSQMLIQLCGVGWRSMILSKV